MIDKETIKTIISVGDVVDKFLINCIKIERIEKNTGKLKTDNIILIDIIKEWTSGYDNELIDEYTRELKKVLEKQWEYLDVVFSEEEGIDSKKEYALLAQQLNIERVKWKNKINEVCGHSKEIKKYG